MELRNYMAEDYYNLEFNCYRDGPGSEIQRSGPRKYTLFVNRIPMELTDGGLRNMFQKAGEVRSAVVKKPKCGNDYAYGFVDYSTASEAANAIHIFQDYKAGKYKLYVSMARDPTWKLTPTVNGTGDAGPGSFGRGSALKSLNKIPERKPGDPLQSWATPQAKAGPATAAQDSQFAQQPQAAISKKATPPANPKNLVKFGPCTKCGKDAYRRCDKCKMPYCSAVCQKEDWPRHKVECSLAVLSPEEFEARFAVSIDEEEILGQVEQLQLQKDQTPRTPPKQPAVQSPVQTLVKSSAQTPVKSPPPSQTKEKPKSWKNSGLMTPDSSSVIEAPSGSRSPNHNYPAERPRSLSHDVSRAVLPLKKPVQVCVSHVESPHEIWVQRCPDEGNQLTVMSQKIYKSNVGGQVTSPAVGELYGAEFQGGWYRAKVAQLMPRDNKVQVLYVDYGNKDIVSIDQLRHLPDSVINHPLQGIQCCLAEVVPADRNSDWPQNIGAALLEMVYGKLFTCCALQELAGTYTVNLCTEEGMDVAKMLVISGLAGKGPFSPAKPLSGPCKTNPNHKPSPPSKRSPSNSAIGKDMHRNSTPSLTLSFKKEELEVGSSVEVMMAHIETWDTIYLHKMQNLLPLSEIMLEISQCMMGSSGSVNAPQVGMLCAAKYPVDMTYYRATVSRVVTHEKSEVHFLDYGNSVVVANSNLRQLPERMFQLPAQALHCSLVGVKPLDSKQSWPKVVEAMLQTLQSETYMCNVVSKTGDVYHVSLIYNSGRLKGQSIADLLVKAGDVLPYNNPNKAWRKPANGQGENEREHDRSNGQNHQRSQKGGKGLLSTPPHQNQVPNGKPFTQPLQPKVSPPMFTPMLQQKKQQQQPPQEMSEPILDEKHVSAREVDKACLTIGESQKVFVQWVENPSAIWVMRGEQESVTIMAAIDKVLKMCCTKPTALSQLPREGCLCAASVNINDKRVLCRAEVLQHTKLHHAMVRCVDLGIKEEVHLQHLQALPSEAATYPTQAIQCQLKGVGPRKADWPKEVMDRLTSICPQDEVMTADVVACMKGVYIVDFLKEGQNTWMSEELGLDKKKQQTRPASSSTKPLSSQGTKRLYEDRDLKSLVEGLKVGQQLKLYVISCYSPDDFIVQMVDPVTVIAYKQIASEVEAADLDNQPSHLPDAVGELVMAKYEEKWYRAKVLSLSGSNAEVLYLDYGNKDLVAQASLRALQPQWATLPALGISCFLHGLSPPSSGLWPPEVMMHLASTVAQNQSNDKSFVSEVREVKQNRLGIDIIVNDGHSLVKEVKKILAETEEIPAVAVRGSKGSSTAVQASPSLLPLIATSTAQLKHYALSMDGSREKAKVVVVISPSSIYVQPADAEAKILPMMEALNKACSQDPKVPAEVQVGDFVAAVFSEDKLWYRARVDAVSAEKYQVLYVDYGNSAVVTLEEIRSLPLECCSLPIQSIHCGLAGLEECEDALKLAQEILDQTMEVMAVSIEDGFYWVQMRVPHTQRVINQEFGAKQRAVSPAPVPASVPPTAASPAAGDLAVYLPHSCQFMAYLTSCTSPSNIYCQVFVPELLEELKEIEIKLKAHCDSSDRPKDFTPRIGEILGSKFSMDMRWYRGVVEEVREDGCFVRFIDYGNSEVVPMADLRPLTPELLNRRKCAFKVAVHGVKPAGESWPEEVTELMRSLENAEAKMEVKGVAKDGVTLIVTLLLTKVLGQTFNECLSNILRDAEGTMLDNEEDAPPEEIQSQFEALLARNAARIGSSAP